MRRRFEEELKELHVELIRMGSLCEQAIALSSRVLQEKNEKLRSRIKEIEESIDEKERRIETICMGLILMQQPVAGDLWAISAAMKMISDMERIGDQAADIANLAPYITELASKSKIHIGDMARAAVSMVTDSIDAFVKNDLELARSVRKDDDIVDELFTKVKKELGELISQNNVRAEEALDLLMAAKYFERIGDHAVNIAEWVEYSITGEYKTEKL